MTVQELTYLQQHQLMQRIDHELSQNLALKLETELDVLEQIEPEENDDDWNPDFNKPPDEDETGDPLIPQETVTWEILDIPTNLEQAVIQRFINHPDQLEEALQHIDYYRIYGCLPEDADTQLHEDLAVLEKSEQYQKSPPIHPIFEVMVEGDHVEAHAVPTGLNLRCLNGFGSYTASAEKFIKCIRDRNRVLNDLAYYILEVLQGDFFRQHDLDTALRYLLPVRIKDLSSLLGRQPFTIDNKYLSKLGDHLVSSHLGIFPLNLFLQQKSEIVRFWVQLADKEKRVTKKEKLYWIWNQIENRVEEWDTNDRRHEFILPLKDITIDDIKYAWKKNKQTLKAKN